MNNTLYQAFVQKKTPPRWNVNEEVVTNPVHLYFTFVMLNMTQTK